MIQVPELLKPLIRRIFFRPGLRPRQLRNGALAGCQFMLDLRHDTQVWRGVYEQDLQAWLIKNVKPGDVCIDIGGAEGFFTLLMAKLAGPTGRVLSFEPSSRGDQIRQNLELNSNLPLAPVEIIRGFAGRTDMAASTPDGIPTIGVDHYLASHQIGRVNVVKIDVDGGEIDVFDGMSATFAKHHPHLTVEVHSPELLEGVQNFLNPLNYKMRRVEPPPHEHRPIPFNPTLFSE